MWWHHVDLSTVYQQELGLNPDYVNETMSSGGAQLAQVLHQLPIICNDKVIDIGCGKGGALITLSDFPFSKVTGLELSETFFNVAKNNLKKLRISHVDVICCDATEYTDYDVYNYVYMYNPFKTNVMELFLNRLAMSLQHTPRKLTLIYANPICHNTIMNSMLFKQPQVIIGIDHLTYHIYKTLGATNAHCAR